MYNKEIDDIKQRLTVLEMLVKMDLRRASDSGILPPWIFKDLTEVEEGPETEEFFLEEDDICIDGEPHLFDDDDICINCGYRDDRKEINS